MNNVFAHFPDSVSKIAASIGLSFLVSSSSLEIVQAQDVGSGNIAGKVDATPEQKAKIVLLKQQVVASFEELKKTQKYSPQELMDMQATMLSVLMHIEHLFSREMDVEGMMKILKKKGALEAGGADFDFTFEGEEMGLFMRSDDLDYIKGNKAIVIEEPDYHSEYLLVPQFPSIDGNMISLPFSASHSSYDGSCGLKIEIFPAKKKPLEGESDRGKSFLEPVYYRLPVWKDAFEGIRKTMQIDEAEKDPIVMRALQSWTRMVSLFSLSDNLHDIIFYLGRSDQTLLDPGISMKYTIQLEDGTNIEEDAVDLTPYGEMKLPDGSFFTLRDIGNMEIKDSQFLAHFEGSTYKDQRESDTAGYFSIELYSDQKK